MRTSNTVGSSSDKLKKVMRDNAGNFIINKDGFVSANLKSPTVQKRIREQISKLKALEI